MKKRTKKINDPKIEIDHEKPQKYVQGFIDQELFDEAKPLMKKHKQKIKQVLVFGFKAFIAQAKREG